MTEHKITGWNDRIYTCKIHGLQGSSLQHMIFTTPNGDKFGPVCWECLIDALKKLGVQECTEVKDD